MFAEFLSLMGAKGSSPTREADLADHTQFLLVHFCHPVEAVRKAAGILFVFNNKGLVAYFFVQDQYILAMAERFPQVLWSKPCLVTLMELLECVGTGAVSRPLDMISATLPSSGYRVCTQYALHYSVFSHSFSSNCQTTHHPDIACFGE